MQKLEKRSKGVANKKKNKKKEKNGHSTHKGASL